MSVVGFIYGNNKIAYTVRKIMIGMRLYYPYNLLSMRKMRLEHQDLLLESRKYYSENIDRIKNCFSSLSDELSKETWMKIIRLRQSYKRKYIPEYDYHNQYFPQDIPGFANGGQ